MSFKLQIPWKFGKVTLKGSIYICGLCAFHQNTLWSPSLPLLNRKLENCISKIEIRTNYSLNQIHMKRVLNKMVYKYPTEGPYWKNIKLNIIPVHERITWRRKGKIPDKLSGIASLLSSWDTPTKRATDESPSSCRLQSYPEDATINHSNKKGFCFNS